MTDLNNYNHLTIAVTGLKTGDNPQPGVPVIRSIKNAGFKGKIIGLTYDALESGIYLDDFVDEVYLIPYPNAGSEAFISRLDYILSKTKIDIIIPTLDSEIIQYVRLESDLRKRGIKTFLPSETQLTLRDKTKLAPFFQDKEVKVPKTELINDEDSLNKFLKETDFPLFIKGRFYEAYMVYNKEDCLKYFNILRDKWGLPIILQEVIQGDEFNIVLIGDGKGGMYGMIPQRKLIITDKGKGFGGVVVNNMKLNQYAEKVISSLNWRGPCELEIIKDQADDFYLIEINPRFPAWVRLAEGAGQNLPAMLVRLILGEEIEYQKEYKTGTMFIRHAEDIITSIETMGIVSTQSELNKKRGL